MYQPFNPFPPVKGYPEYDILLGISQQQLQKQLDTLYKTAIGDADYVPPPGEKDTRVKRYLIDHELEILLPRISKKNPARVFTDEQREGIRGHIDCPQIEFVPSKPRQVRMKFTFQKDPAAAHPDSVVRYLDEDATISELPINGWTLSFIADLATSQPMDIMKDILNPAGRQNDPTVLPPMAKEKFEELVKRNEDEKRKADENGGDKPVDSRTFLASSIFCLFQSAQLINTFQVTAPPEDTTKADDLSTIRLLANGFDLHFGRIQRKSKAGVPTVDNPFVLGYSILQELQTIGTIAPNANTKKTPTYLKLRRYDISATPAPQNYDSVPGCLNFCLQTFRANRSEQRDVDITMVEQSSNGVFSNPLIQNNAPNGIPSASHSGVMIISRKIFLEKYIFGTFAPIFWMEPADLLKQSGKKVNTSTTTFKDSTPEDPIYEKKVVWSADGETLIPNDFQMAFIERSGVSKLSIECSSDWSRAEKAGSSDKLPTDAERGTYITINTESTITVEHSQVAYASGDGLGAGLLNLANAIIGSKTTGGEPVTTHTIYITLRYRYVFSMRPSTGGVWKTTLIESESTQPVYDASNKLQFERHGSEDKSADTKLGTYVRIVKGAFQGVFEDLFQQNQISENIATEDFKLGAAAVDDVAERGKALSEELQQATVMMPAGDAFTFTGLDTDRFGNLYSNINYRSITDGERVDQTGSKP